MILAVIEAVALSLAISLDAFATSVAYGSSKIKMPLASVIVVSVVSSGVLGASLLLGSVLKSLISVELCSLISFGALFAMGMVKVLDNFTKELIKRWNGFSKKIKFSLLNFNFALRIYADPKVADADKSKSISVCEAFFLAIALSIDGVAVGIGAALGNTKPLLVFLIAFLVDTGAILLGLYIGARVCSKLKFNMAWVSGAVLIIMAFVKLAG